MRKSLHKCWGDDVTLVQLAAFAGVIVAVGGASVVIQKGLRAMRRFARLLDGFLGDGTGKHPSVPERMEAIDQRMTTLEAQATSGIADVKADVAAIKSQTASIEHKLDTHVDGDAKTWLADGQAWGNRLDGQVADLGTRVSALEGHPPA